MSIARSKAVHTLFAIGFALSIAGCGGSKNEYVAPPPPEVTVANPVKADVTPFVEQNGETEAVEEAEVRARVRGFLESIEFQPGQNVKAGDVLYKIERDQYEAEVNSAAATVAAAEAAIAVANALIKTADAEVEKTAQDLKREELLKERNASSQAEYDAAVAAARAAEAERESAKANAEAAAAEKGRAEANLAQAKLDLDYTIVQAPIAGRITKTNFKVGNLVENGSNLATVVNDDNIFANFSISDRSLLKFMEARRAALQAGEQLDDDGWRGSPVYMRRETDDGFPFAGTMDYLDQAGIQADTGTLGLRAIFENSDGRLLPGLFVTVRVPAAESVPSLLVPESATLRDQQGTFVLTINSDQKVEKTPITISQSVSGWAIIQSGIDTSSRVVVDGLQRARPGLEVVATDRQLVVDDFMLMRGMKQPSSEVDEASGEATKTDDATADSNED